MTVQYISDFVPQDQFVTATKTCFTVHVGPEVRNCESVNPLNLCYCKKNLYKQQKMHKI